MEKNLELFKEHQTETVNQEYVTVKLKVRCIITNSALETDHFNKYNNWNSIKNESLNS